MPKADERRDLALLLVAALAVPALWLAFGWRLGHSLAAHDEVAQNLLLIREVAAGGWSGLRYRPDFLGGFEGRDVLGAFPLFPLFAWLGGGPVTISTASAFLVQALLGFLLARGGLGLALALHGRWPDWPGRGAALVLTAFAPALAWRFGMGHLNLATGLLALSSALALLTAAATSTLTATLAAAAAAGFLLALSYSGQQMVVYGAVFGGPVLLGLWWSLAAPARRLGAPALVATAGILLALPALQPMVAHARSTDAARRLGQEVVTYDLGPARAADLLASLPWARAGGEAATQHEANVPAGPLLLALALLPWRRLRPLAVGVLVALVLALVVSLDLAPLSRWFIAALPPLRAFRVPGRAFLPLVMLLPVLAIAALSPSSEAPAPTPAEGAPNRARRRHEPASPPRSSPPWGWLAIAMALLVLILPPWPREIVLWGATLGALAARRRTLAIPLLMVLAAGSLAAFRERLAPFANPTPPLAEAARIGEALRQARPDLRSPLTRLHLGLTVPALGPNTAFAAGLSSLDGYQAPPRRFGELVFALRGQPHQPTAVVFTFGPGDPAFPPLQQLYNVRYEASLEGAGRLRLGEFGPTAGAAWFAASVERVDSLPTLAERLKEPGLHERAPATAWVVAGDPRARGLPATVDPACHGARVTELDALALPLRARVETPAECPLVFAMSATEDLLAVARGPDRETALPIFPAYGALAGVMVPQDAREVRVLLRPDPLWPWAGPPVGLGLLLLALLRLRASGVSGV